MPNIDIPDASNLTGMMEWEGKNKKPNAEQVEIDFKRFEGDIYVVLIGETREVTLRVSPGAALRLSAELFNLATPPKDDPSDKELLS